MSLIAAYLPVYTVREIHSAVVPAGTRRTYEIVRNFQFKNSLLSKILLFLRGFPPDRIGIQSVLGAGFIFLEERQEREFALGLIGKFWTPSGCLKHATAKEFIEFQQKGVAKAVWNFTFERVGDNETRLTTETRVFCPDEKSTIKFKLYWFFVGPFSGIIRREILRSIKDEVMKS